MTRPNYDAYHWDRTLLYPMRRSARQEATRALSRCACGLIRKNSVHPDADNPLRWPHRISEGGRIDDLVWIKQNEVGGESFANDAAMFQPEPLRGHARHLENCFVDWDQLFVAAVPSQDPRKRSPQPRMRARIIRQSIRSDHRRGMRQDLPHVVFRNAVINRARGAHPPRRFELGQVPDLGDSRQRLPGNLGMRRAPGDGDFHAGIDLAKIERARTGRIWITITANLLLSTRRF